MKTYTIILLSISLLLVSCSNKQLIKVELDYMYPTIQWGDYVRIDKSVDLLDYGDIVYYHFKGDEGWNAYHGLFRIVGLPGDSISITNYICTINGVENKHTSFGWENNHEVHEEVLPNGASIRIAYIVEDPGDFKEPIKIPDNHYYLLGDQRAKAIDSRYFGPVSKEEILGKVVKIIEGDRDEYFRWQQDLMK